MCSTVSPTASYEAVASERLHARSLAALMAAYPSTSASTAAFDQYSEYSDDCSADSESFSHGATQFGGAMKSFKNPLSKCAGSLDQASSGDESLSTGLSTSWPAKSKDQVSAMSASALDEVSALSGSECPPSDQRGVSSNEITDSHYEESCVSSSDESDTEELVHKKPLGRVYPLALMLRVQAVVSACTTAMPTSSLRTKRIDELPSTTQPVPASVPQKQKRGVAQAGSVDKPGRQRAVVPPANAADERIAKAARSAMTTISSEKLQGICDKLAPCGIHSASQLAVVLHEISEKAVTQHLSTAVCADLCVRLKSDPRFESAAGPEGGPQSYRQLLLDECWPRFLQLTNDGDGAEQDSDKKQALGNMKFMGDLITRGLMSPRLLVDCAEALLNRYMACTTAVDVLEALVALLKAGGAHVDSVVNWVHAERLNRAFSKMHEMAGGFEAPLSARLLLRDVLTLRDAGWRSQTEVVAAPKQRPDDFRTPHGTRSALGLPEKDMPHKQQPRPVETSKPGQQSMLSLAREMLLAPVAAPTLRGARNGTRPAARNINSAPVLSYASSPAPISSIAPAFEPKIFRRELSATLRDLAADGNAAAAVRRIRAQNVPLSHQSRELTDLLTRAVEIPRKAARHSAFAFAAGLAAASPSAFDRDECLAGVAVFFREVYEDLCEEVSQLPSLVEREMLPTLRSVFSEEALRELLPESLKDIEIKA